MRKVRKLLTPKEFAARVLELQREHENDPEAAHGETDELMEQTLRTLGYGDAVRLIRKQTRWYA